MEYPGVQDNVGQTLSCPNEKDCEPSQDLSKQIRVCVWGVSHVSHDLSRATQKLILTGRRENPRPARDASRSAAVEVGHTYLVYPHLNSRLGFVNPGLETMDQPEVTWPARCLVPDHRRNDRKTKVRGSGLGMFKFVSKRSQPRGDYSRHCPVRVKGFFVCHSGLTSSFQ